MFFVVPHSPFAFLSLILFGFLFCFVLHYLSIEFGDGYDCENNSA